jgi:hypothetical protein
MNGDVLLLPLSDLGEWTVVGAGSAAFVLAFVVSLIPMPTAATALLVAAVLGVAAWALFLGSLLGGEEIVFWAIVAAAVVIGWSLGFVPAAVVRAAVRVAERFANTS